MATRTCTSQIDDEAAFGGGAALRSGACGGSALSLARARGVVVALVVLVL